MHSDLEIIKIFAIIFLTLFVLFTFTVAMVERRKGRRVEWTRILLYFLIYSLILICLALPPITLTILVSLFIFLSIQEIFNTARGDGLRGADLIFRIFSQFVAIPLPLLMHFSPVIVPIYLIFTIIMLFWLPIFIRDYTKARERIGQALICLGFSTMVSYLILLRLMDHGVALCIFLIFLAAVSDTGAYVFGKMLGRRKLVPHLSPDKTIEGSVSALMATVLIALLFQHYILPQYQIWQVLVFACMISISAQLGDLSFSVFKREMGIKSYRNLIPGHGGVLDRFDSLVMAPPLFYYLLKLLS